MPWALDHTAPIQGTVSSSTLAHGQVCVTALHASDDLPGSKTLVEMVEENYYCVRMFSC